MSVSSWLFRMRGPKFFLAAAEERLEGADPDSALDHIDSAERLFGDSDEFMWYRARCHFAKSQFFKSFTSLRDGGIHSPESADELFRWGQSLEDANDFDRARDLYQIIADFRNGQEAAHAHFRRARLFRFQQQTRQMMEEVFLSLERGDHDDVFSMFFGMNSEEERLEMLRHLPRIENLYRKPGRRRVALNLTLASIHCKNHDFDKAAKYIRKARSMRTWKSRRMADGRSRGPDFFIIGTAKSGTTSLYSSIVKHPKVISAVRKELHYFYNPHATEEWYLAHFPVLPAHGEFITGEATPNYYAHPIQEKMKSRFPDAKLIFLMRDPARRAVSQYYHSRRHGAGGGMPIDEFFQMDSVRELLSGSDDEIENRLFSHENDSSNTMITYSLYYYFLRRWFRHFKREQILLLKLEDFKRDQQGVLNQVYRHIGVKETDHQDFGHQYKGRYEIKDPVVQNVLTNLTELYEVPNRKLFEEFGVNFSPD